MEPTIEGDPNQGDRVLVDKLWDNFSNPSRFHLVVFNHKEKTVVKRIAGLPNEWFKIEDFDLWVGQEASALHRIQKSPSKDLDMFSTYWDNEKSPGGFKGKRWVLSSSAHPQKKKILLDGTGTEEETLFADAARIHLKDLKNRGSTWHMRFKGRITTGYIDGSGRLKEASSGKMSAARDFGIKGRLTLDRGGKLWVLYRYFNAPYILILGGGRVRIWKEGKLLSQSPILPELLVNKKLNLALVFLDGRFCLSINGHDTWKYKPNPSRPSRFTLKLFPGNELMLAASGGKVFIQSLSIIHDFHYLAIGEYGSWKPIRLQSNQYFVLGDNSEDSQDSRHFGPIRGSKIIGRPLMVVAPKKRAHFFLR